MRGLDAAMAWAFPAHQHVQVIGLGMPMLLFSSAKVSGGAAARAEVSEEMQRLSSRNSPKANIRDPGTESDRAEFAALGPGSRAAPASRDDRLAT